ncbi:DUF2971 domain-containing protein [Lacihabitans sp. LS3-19]|uniref:DUF2971 domain-containing protein n=1 Tax=Lacihabitans sp. LS3-19 TaxID=2487335 RepID=UPI0020CC6B8B|nr:DUF2971 domain-containing protein [Lacihabitans sp. LS3-19]MCP9766693.1 DUF2971 domain-containing protein [Lacihabitans sp. LS3-19]
MKGYKFRGLGSEEFERDFNSIINNQIFASKIEDLNDPFEASVIIEKLEKSLDFFNLMGNGGGENVKEALYSLLAFKSKIGIYSLSKTNSHKLLWSHYASGGKGYCLEYNIDKLKLGGFENSFEDLFQVEYLEKTPELKIDDILNQKTFSIKLFATKSKDWEYEKEIRLIYNNSSLKNYHSSALSSIFFGVNMPDSYQNRLIEALDNRNIKFYKSFKEKNSYMFKWQLIHENKRNIVNSIDKYSFQILKTNHNQMVENYYVYVKTPLLNIVEINYFLKAFRENFATKISTINLFDSEKVLKLIGVYPLNRDQYLFYADHFIACSNAFEEDLIQWYPLQDYQYKQYGGLNWKKDKFE